MKLPPASPEAHGIPHLPSGQMLSGVCWLKENVRQRQPPLPGLIRQGVPRGLGCPAFVQFIQNRVEVPVMDRPPEPLPGTLLQQMGKFVAAGVGQQVQGAELPAKVTPLLNFPSGQPATGCLRLVLGGNHANAVGDLVLLVAGIEPVVGGLAGTDPAIQGTARAAFPDPVFRGLPEAVASDGTHQLAKAKGGLG